MMRVRKVIGPVATAATLVAAAAAAAAPTPPRVICSTLPDHPTSTVPGAPSYRFRPGADSPFASPQVSAVASRWYMRSAVVDRRGQEAGEVILLGTGRRVAVLDDVPVAPQNSAPLSAADPLAKLVVRRAEGGLVRLHEALVGVSATAPASGGPNLLPVAPESGGVAFHPSGWYTAPGGGWMVRGTDAAGVEWVFRGGIPIAASGWPVTLRSQETERFETESPAGVFFTMQTNRSGDAVVGGHIDAPDAAADEVLVFNAARILAREGDPVDLDGDGVAEEDVRLGEIARDGGVLTEEGAYYFVASLRSSTGEMLGHALLVVRVCKADWDGSGVADSGDIAAFLADWLRPPTEEGAVGDFNCDGVINSADVAGFFEAWAAAALEGC